jgi:hypothetical protein
VTAERAPRVLKSRLSFVAVSRGGVLPPTIPSNSPTIPFSLFLLGGVTWLIFAKAPAGAASPYAPPARPAALGTRPSLVLSLSLSLTLLLSYSLALADARMGAPEKEREQRRKCLPPPLAQIVSKSRFGL